MDKHLLRAFRTCLTVLCVTLAAPLVVTPALASELDNLAPGHWYEVPDSKLRAVVPDPTPEGNVESVIAAWSGGALDSQRNRLLVWGGGHADYSGNEIYAFDLDTLKWELVSEPSLNVGGSPDSGEYPDGKPRSRHTYDYLEYLPEQDLFCTFGGAALYPSGNTSTFRTDCFDFRSSQWVRRASVPGLGGSELESVSAYDHSSGAIYYKNKYTSNVGRYDPAKDRWEELDAKFYLSGKKSAAIDSKSRVMVIVGEGDTAFFNLETGEYDSVSTSGRGPSSRAPGLTYDLANERVVAWDGGAEVYSLDVDSKTWITHEPASSNNVVPPDQTKWGTFGRFRYVPSMNLFVVANDIDQNVYIYKLSPGDGVVEKRVEPNPPESLRAEPDGQ